MTTEDAKKAIRRAIDNPDDRLKGFADKCKSAANKAKGKKYRNFLRPSLRQRGAFSFSTFL